MICFWRFWSSLIQYTVSIRFVLSQECEILIVVVRLQGSREIHWGTDVDDWRQNSQSAFELRKALEAWLTFLLCHTGYGNTDDEEKEGEKRKLLQLVSNYFFWSLFIGLGKSFPTWNFDANCDAAGESSKEILFRNCVLLHYESKWRKKPVNFGIRCLLLV